MRSLLSGCACCTLGGYVHAHHRPAHHHYHNEDIPPVHAEGAFQADVAAREHEGAAIASCTLEVVGRDSVMPFAAVLGIMQDTARSIERAGGVVGHVKALAMSRDDRVRASVVTADTEPTVIGGEGLMLGRKHAVKLAAIAMAIDPHTLQAALVEAIETAR